MLITPHAVTGALIATRFNSPFLAIPLSIASHFLLDKIPHWQETLYPYKVTRRTWIRIFVDLSFAFFLVYFISIRSPQNSQLIWINAFVSSSLDLDSVAVVYKPILKIKILKYYYHWHVKIQRETSSLWGIITQLVVVLIALKLAL